MFNLRKGAIISLGMFAGVGINPAQACDNDRFPCPVVSEAVTQETAARQLSPFTRFSHPRRRASPLDRPQSHRSELTKACHAPKRAKRPPLPARRVKRRLRSSGPLPAPRMISRPRRRYLLLRLFSRQLRMNRPGTRIKLWWPLPGQLGRLFPPSIIPRCPQPPLRRKRNRQPNTPAPSKLTAGPSFPVTGQCLAISL